VVPAAVVQVVSLYKHVIQTRCVYNEYVNDSPGHSDRPARHQLHAYVSPVARDGWYEFAARHGTSVSALLEATGILMGEHVATKKKALPGWLRTLVAEANAVATIRSSRRRRPDAGR
jgi:hypothetical protein